MRLQAEFDDRLRATGFRDIENGDDTNLYDSSTFQAPRGGMPRTVDIGREAGIDDDLDNVFSAPAARAWALFGQAAHELSTDPKTRDILLAVADSGSRTEAALRIGVPYETVKTKVAGLCEAIGIEYRNLFGNRGGSGRYSEKTPAPAAPKARRLTKREIRRLVYTSPMSRTAG